VVGGSSDWVRWLGKGLRAGVGVDAGVTPPLRKGWLYSEIVLFCLSVITKDEKENILN